MADKKFKPTFPQLALLDWLFERDRCRFFTYTARLDSTSEIGLYETSGVDEGGKKKLVRVFPTGAGKGDVELLERLGGRSTIQTHTLYQQKFLTQLGATGGRRESFDKFMSQFSNENWHWAEIIYVPTDAARTYWQETGRGLFLAAAEKRKGVRAAVDRLVIVGARAKIHPRIPRELAERVPAGMTLPIPVRTAVRPQALARVVKETETRLYLSEVKPLRERAISEAYAVEGFDPNLYVARENVILDHADARIARRLAQIDAEHVEDLNRIAEQAVEAILPALISLESKFLQKDAERADMLREAIADFEASAERSPRP